MASYNIICASGTSNVSVNLNSTKVKVLANVAVYYATGASPAVFTSGNCAAIPANTVRDINVGPGTQVTANAAVVSGVGPKIAFVPVGGGAALIEVTEIGYVNFYNTTN